MWKMRIIDESRSSSFTTTQALCIFTFISAWKSGETYDLVHDISKFIAWLGGTIPISASSCCEQSVIFSHSTLLRFPPLWDGFVASWTLIFRYLRGHSR